LGNADANDALTLTVNGTTASATDLITLDGKTSVDVSVTVSAVTGTYADLNTVYVTNGANYANLGDEAITITDTTSATNVNTIVNKTTGIVTATVTADTAANLNTNLSNATATDALTLTVNGTSATGADLTALDGKTNVAITISSSSGFTVSMAEAETLNLSGFTNNVTGGNLTISDNTGNENITGTAGNDILNMSSGNDTVNLGGGNDTINVTVANLDINDNITDASGTDILNITTSGTIDSANLIDVSGIETLNLSSGDDTITFDTVTEFNNFRNEFTTDIVDAGGTDSLSFGSSAISGDLDFSKLAEFENLNLSSVADSLIVSGDEPDIINGLGGDDTFTINFSNLANFDFDGGSGTDTVSVNGTGTGATADGADFGTVTSATFTNIETLDLTGLDFSGFGDDQEYLFTDALLDSWNGAGSTFTLKINAEDAENIKFTEQSGTIRDGNGAGDSGNTITTGDYDLGNTTLHIDIV